MSTTEQTVIGFDLGHGETALAIADVAATDAPKVIDLPGASRRQHVTAVARTRSGEVLIGEEAIRRDDIARLWVAFKSRDLDDPDVASPMSLLVQRIVADLVEQGTIPDSGAATWVFGAPSGWEAEHYRNYEKLLVDAGLGGAKVIPESRAALLYARDSGEVATHGERIAQRVLIVDIGSSTTDYTFVTDLREQPCDHGNVSLGAGLIDKEILRFAVERNAQSAEVLRALAQDPHSRRKLELGCRESKEKFFRARREELERTNGRVGGLHPVDTVGGASFVVDLRLTLAEMDAVLTAPQEALGGRSWSGAFAEDVASAIRQSGEVDLLLLTGGPSRMPFVVETCRRLLGRGKVALGNEPEVAIARGLALAGRTSVRAEGFRRDIAKLKRKIKPLVKDKTPALAAAMAAAVADGMTERHIIPAFVAWREMRVPTLDVMKSYAVGGVRRDLDPAHNERLAAAIAEWQTDLRSSLDSVTRPICNTWHIDPGAMRLPDMPTTHDTNLDVYVDTGAITDRFDTAANVINGIIAGIIAMTLFGAGTAVLAVTGPFAVIVAGIVGFAALTAGKEAIMEKVSGYEFPQKARAAAAGQATMRKLRERAAADEDRMRASLVEQFTGQFDSTMVDQVTKGLLAQLDDQADEAELLIK